MSDAVPQVKTEEARIQKIVDGIQDYVFDDLRIEDLGEAFKKCCAIVTRRHYRLPEKRRAIRDELSDRFQGLVWKEHYAELDRWFIQNT